MSRNDQIWSPQNTNKCKNRIKYFYSRFIKGANSCFFSCVWFPVWLEISIFKMPGYGFDKPLECAHHMIPQREEVTCYELENDELSLSTKELAQRLLVGV